MIISWCLNSKCWLNATTGIDNTAVCLSVARFVKPLTTGVYDTTATGKFTAVSQKKTAILFKNFFRGQVRARYTNINYKRRNKYSFGLLVDSCPLQKFYKIVLK
jgi:hypothetical protein